MASRRKTAVPRKSAVPATASVETPAPAKCFSDYVVAGDAASKLARYKRQVKAFCELAEQGNVILEPEDCKIGGAYRSAFEAFCKDNPNL